MAIDLFSIGRFTVHGYGLMIGLGFLAAVLLGIYRAKKLDLSPDHLTGLAIYVLLFGFLGGKLLFLIVEFDAFLSNPLGAIGSEGFVVYGGIITGFLTIILYCKIKKCSVLSYMDLLAPCIAVNQSLGRVGCFLAGCCYGRETDHAFGVIFPEGCLAPAGVKLVPTQLISAAGMMLIAIGLILYQSRAKFKGCVAGYYLLSYSIGRFVIEFFRNDDRGTVGTWSTSQFISILIFVFAVGMLLFMYRKRVPVCGDAEFRRLSGLAEVSAAETDTSASEKADMETATLDAETLERKDSEKNISDAQISDAEESATDRVK